MWLRVSLFVFNDAVLLSKIKILIDILNQNGTISSREQLTRMLSITRVFLVRVHRPSVHQWWYEQRVYLHRRWNVLESSSCCYFACCSSLFLTEEPRLHIIELCWAIDDFLGFDFPWGLCLQQGTRRSTVCCAYQPWQWRLACSLQASWSGSSFTCFHRQHQNIPASTRGRESGGW